MSEIIGRATYANGERQIFTDPEEFIKTVREELPYRSTSGFAFEVTNADAATRKAIDDLVYNEYGEKNPHDLDYYQEKDRSIPVYRQSAAYAREHDELPDFRASNKANIACKEVIEKAINCNYRDNCLDSKSAFAQVAEMFGTERLKYVLAVTVRQKDWDGRISHENKAWAKTVPVADNQDAFGSDRNCYFVVDQAHTGLVDLLVTYARKQFAAEKDAPVKKPSVLDKLQSTPSVPKSSAVKCKDMER